MEDFEEGNHMAAGVDIEVGTLVVIHRCSLVGMASLEGPFHLVGMPQEDMLESMHQVDKLEVARYLDHSLQQHDSLHPLWYSPSLFYRLILLSNGCART